MGLSNARELWREWGIRVMVLSCLLVQLLLSLIMCSRRIRFRHSFIKFVVWLLYSLADALSIFTLGMISFKLGVASVGSGPLNEQSKLIAFWAPILFLFLGGPDAISALSLEDNELWKRQLLVSVSQAAWAFYTITLAWTPSYLSYLAITMFVVAASKCGEKTWVRWNASTEKLRSSMLSPNPGTSYPRFMDQYTSRQCEGYRVRLYEIVEANPEPSDLSADHAYARDVVRAHALFPRFRRLFADLILSYNDRDASISIFSSIRSAIDAFRVVEIELHFMYELLHTKARWLYTLQGLLARLATSISTLGVSIAFSINSYTRGEHHFKSDRIVTMVLLVGVSLQELYFLFTLWYSHAPNSWHLKEEISIISRITPSIKWSKQPRWSNSMGQFCLLKFFIKDGTWPAFSKLLEAFGLEKSWHTSYEDISDYLKGFLYSSLKDRIVESSHGYRSRDGPEEVSNVLKKHNAGDLTWSAPTTKGETLGTGIELSNVLEKHNVGDLTGSATTTKGETLGAGIEFDHSILVWHIATELCYHADKIGCRKVGVATLLNLELSQKLSRYMTYLLVNYPFMLPGGISHIRIRDTYADAIQFLEDAESYDEACDKLLKLDTQVEPCRVVGSISKSVLFEAARLASMLINHETKDRLRVTNDRSPETNEEFLQWKWETIANVWCQFIVCAAKKSRGGDHAKQLSAGGELLTQVWMMMAHFGLTGHFQMRRGSVMDRLVLE